MEEIKKILGSMKTLVEFPFEQGCITNIIIDARQRLVGTGWRFTGHVCFKKNNTEGRQNFEGQNLADVFNQIAEFCQGL